MHAIGVVSYAAIQWWLLLVFSIIGGYEAAGAYALAQAITGPIFALCMFSLRQLWVSHVIQDLSLIKAIKIRLIFIFIAITISFFCANIFDYSGALEIFVFVLVIKSCDAISDIMYGSVDMANRNKTWIFLFIKSIILSIPILISFRIDDVVIICEMLSIAMITLVFTEFYFVKENFNHIANDGSFFVFKSLVYLYPALTALVVSLAGFMPRYILNNSNGLEVVGYYSITIIPYTLMLLIVTGFSQYKLPFIAKYINDFDGGVFKIIRKDVAFILLLLLIISFIVYFFDYIFGMERVFPDSISDRIISNDMIYFLWIGFFYCMAQYLSYVAIVYGKVKWLFFIAIISTVGQFFLYLSFEITVGVDEIGFIQLIGAILQIVGFLVVINGSVISSYFNKYVQ